METVLIRPLRFDVLRELNESERSFLELHRQIGRGSFATLEQILNDLIAEGLVAETRTPTPRGLPKRILRLTEKGQQVYRYLSKAKGVWESG